MLEIKGLNDWTVLPAVAFLQVFQSGLKSLNLQLVSVIYESHSQSQTMGDTKFSNFLFYIGQNPTM